MAEFVTVTDAAGLDAELAAFEVKGTGIAIANVDGTFYAFDDTCTHLQCSLAEGDLEEAVVTCPCHGSRFDVRTGALLRGPAQEPVRSYQLRVENGAVQVEI